MEEAGTHQLMLKHAQMIRRPPLLQPGFQSYFISFSQLEIAQPLNKLYAASNAHLHSGMAIKAIIFADV